MMTEYDQGFRAGMHAALLLIERASMPASVRVRLTALLAPDQDRSDADAQSEQIEDPMVLRMLKFMRRKDRPVTKRELQMHLKSALSADQIEAVMMNLASEGRITIRPRQKTGVMGAPLSSPGYVLVTH